MKKKLILLFMIFLFPIQVFAYSNKIIVSGEAIGIDVYSDGVYIVGFYPVHEMDIAKKAGFQVGDRILSIDGVEVQSIHSLYDILEDEKTYQFQIIRNQKNISIPFKVLLEDQSLKTGLYVKDQVHGIGTLSYIDPETKVFASLGHEILESTSKSRFEMDSGTIYKAEVTNIQKSKNGSTGAKNAIISTNEVLGEIFRNTDKGIFGIYQDDVSSHSLYDVASFSDIHIGDASIRTVLEGKTLEDYKIKIVSIDEDSSNKNILFEITDKSLLQKTGGIVQGMSGSPILQDNKVIGVVNYVIVDDPKKGYGIFIWKMLEEGDKILE